MQPTGGQELCCTGCRARAAVPPSAHCCQVCEQHKHAHEGGCLWLRTCLFTSTPTARLVIFHTMPVLPWYTL